MDIRLSDLVVNVREIAAGNPTFVYAEEERKDEDRAVNCRNVEQDEEGNWVGSCIVGRGIVELGIGADTLAAEDLEAHSVGFTLTQLRRKGLVNFEDDDVALSWLRCVQALQDNGYPWAEAVEEADGRGRYWLSK